jgi:uncharacterized protein YndB with AHSA1/START domain
MTDRMIIVERFIPAPAEQIFDLLADPAMHPVLDGSGTVQSSHTGNPKRLSLGAKFAMGMKIVGPYRIRNTVSEFEEGRRIGWHHFAHNVWRYELEPVDGGTRVRESFDYSKGRVPAFALRLFLNSHPASMEKTLENIEAYLRERGATPSTQS